MVSIEAFSELLAVLYSVPLEPEKWVAFLALLSEHTESAASALLCANSRSALSVAAQGGGVYFDQNAYNEKYAAGDPFRWNHRMVVSNGRCCVYRDEELLPNEGLLKTDLYRNLLAPVRLRYTAHVVLTLNLRRLEVVTVARTLEQGPMQEDYIHFLNLLQPHIRKALEIRQVLGVAQQRQAGAEAMADASATAAFLLNRRGRVLHLNAAAERLLKQADGLILSDGTLAAAHAHLNESLRKLFQDAAALASPHLPSSLQDKPARALALQRPSGAQPLQLLASPLPPASRNKSKAELVLLVSDPERPVNHPDDVLHALYDLTPAQTEVANGLLTGYTLAEIASLRRVSVGTVRQQVKSILGKTGVSRQSDLIRVLMSLPQSPGP